MSMEHSFQKNSIETYFDTMQHEPHDIHTENALVGTLLWNADRLHDVTDILEPAAFYTSNNKIIFEAMVEVSNKGNGVDSVTVASYIQDTRALDLQEYIKSLVVAAPSAAHIETYARLIREKHIRRQLIEASSKILSISNTTDISTEDVLNNAEAELFKITQHHTNARYKTISSIVPSLVQEIISVSEKTVAHRGIPTGFPSLDTALSGLHKSDLVILAARPSVGKTALALDIARKTSSQHKTPVGIFSLEMSSAQLVERLLASESNLDAWKMRTGKLGEQSNFTRLNDAADTLSKLPIFIDDRSSMTTLSIRSNARRMKREHDIKLLIVDYLQLISPYNSRKSDNLVQHITEVSHTLKQIARELDIPVLALSQLSRDVEKRAGKPRLSDLRDSGSIEQDADVVMFLHRNIDNSYEGEESPTISTDLMIEKHRNGPTSRLQFSFDKKKATYFEKSKDGYHGDAHGYDKESQYEQ